jgi:hypothetical protein
MSSTYPLYHQNEGPLAAPSTYTRQVTYRHIDSHGPAGP